MTERMCSISGCGKRINARGLCGKHYNQVRNGKLSHPAATEILRKDPCAEDGCPNSVYALGWCNMHWQRYYRTGEPGEAGRRRMIYEPGQLCATGCGTSAKAAGYCGNHYRRFSKYNVTAAQVAELLQSQDGRCAICRTGTPGADSSGEWCIDHDHATGQIRGLLCGPCNRALGLLQDDPRVIAAALRYIERHRQPGQVQLFS